jgi:hypothetical protein
MELRKRRKLLVASVGLATITYAVAQTACSSSSSTTGLTGDDAGDGAPPTSGNLPSPPDDGAVVDFDGFATSGNLAAPPPMDAGDHKEAGDAGIADADAGPPADSGTDAATHDGGLSDQ